MKNVLATFAALTLMATFLASYAQASGNHQSYGSPFQSAEQVPDPREDIQQGVKRLQAFISSDAMSDPAMVSVFLEKEIAPFFDFNKMSQMILGPLNYRMNTQQRQATGIMIKKSFLTALASNLSNYRGGKVEYMNINGSLGRGKITVRLAVYLPNEYPTVLELRFARSPLGWKIIDVSANGISAVAHYRNYVRSVVQRSGIEGLLQ